jgi:hypothetical protein
MRFPVRQNSIGWESEEARLTKQPCGRKEETYHFHTQGDSLEELRANIRDAVECYFDETMDAPKIIRLHFVRDEILAR